MMKLVLLLLFLPLPALAWTTDPPSSPSTSQLNKQQLSNSSQGGAATATSQGAGGAASLSSRTFALGLPSTSLGASDCSTGQSFLFGLFAHSHRDDQCRARDLIEALTSLGRYDEALQVTCSMDGAERLARCH